MKTKEKTVGMILLYVSLLLILVYCGIIESIDRLAIARIPEDTEPTQILPNVYIGQELLEQQHEEVMQMKTNLMSFTKAPNTRKINRVNMEVIMESEEVEENAAVEELPNGKKGSATPRKTRNKKSSNSKNNSNKEKNKVDASRKYTKITKEPENRKKNYGLGKNEGVNSTHSSSEPEIISGNSQVFRSLLGLQLEEKTRILPLFLRDITPSPTDHNIYQILTNNPRILRMRHYCSLESHCMQNPQSVVWFLMMGISALEGEPLQVLGSLQKIYPNLRLAKLDFNTTVAGTPLDNLVGKLRKSSFPANHISDVVRLAVVAKFGGMYADFDFIALRSVYQLRNFVAEALPSIIMNGMFHFDAGNKYLQVLMEDCGKNFDGSQWAVNGPLLFVRVMHRNCPDHMEHPVIVDINLATLVRERLNYRQQMDDPSSMKSTNRTLFSEESLEPKREDMCESIQLLDTGAFMPFYLGRMSEMFKTGSSQLIDQIPASSYGIHLFNQITRRNTVEKGSGVELIAQVHCPKTFDTCINDHRPFR